MSLLNKKIDPDIFHQILKSLLKQLKRNYGIMNPIFKILGGIFVYCSVM